MFIPTMPSCECSYGASLLTRDNTPIDELAQLADKVMKVAIHTMLKVAIQPSTHDFEVLQGEITSLN